MWYGAFIRFFAGAQNDSEATCAQGELNIWRRTGIGYADVGGKVEMCAGNIKYMPQNGDRLRRCQLRR